MITRNRLKALRKTWKAQIKEEIEDRECKGIRRLFKTKTIVNKSLQIKNHSKLSNYQIMFSKPVQKLFLGNLHKIRNQNNKRLVLYK
jgi:hypothetical protein